MILSLFLGRLVEFQAIRSSQLAAQGLQQRLQSYEIPADRGTIYDSQGNPLAQTVEVRDITADQTMIHDPVKTATILAAILQLDPAALQAKLTGDKRYVVVAKGVEPAKWRAIQDRRASSAQASTSLEGIFSEKKSAREYPNGTLAANVIGFTNAEGKGATGLEYGLEQELAGKPGNEEAEYGPDGSVIPGSHGLPLRSGRRNLGAADAGLRSAVDRAELPGAAGEGVQLGLRDGCFAMEVGTGRVLAMATVPTFDPNHPSASPATDWQNRPATFALEPGSTMKVLTHSAIIDAGAATPTTAFTVPPSLTRGGHVITNSEAHRTEALTLAGILAKSSNLGTILAAEKLGPDSPSSTCRPSARVRRPGCSSRERARGRARPLHLVGAHVPVDGVRTGSGDDRHAADAGLHHRGQLGGHGAAEADQAMHTSAQTGLCRTRASPPATGSFQPRQRTR